MPACAPMSASPTVWNPRPAASWAAAVRMRSRRSGSRRRRVSGATIWSSWQPGGTVATSEPEITGVAVDFLESDEHRDLRAAVGAVAARFGGDHYVEHARAGTPCDELWSTLGDAGFIGVNVAEEHGGGGGGLVELAIVCEAISGEVIGEFGSPELRNEWLPGLASGRTKVVFAITEPEAGSNTHRLATTATCDADGWVLRGTKHYISGVDEAA